MLGVSQSLTVFGSSMNALGTARIRDRINHTIHKDLELIREQVAAWKYSEVNGKVTYTPPSSNCYNSLATAIINDSTTNLPTAPTAINLSNTGSDMSLKGMEINRSISIYNGGVNTGDGNLLEVNYSSGSNGAFSINRKAVISIPAQGWCQYDQGA